MKVLLVTTDFLPVADGCAQRSLELATHLPAHGIETHVLAPSHADAVDGRELPPPTQAWIHRTRFLGARSTALVDEPTAMSGLERLATRARSLSSRLLVPDDQVGWNLSAIPAALRIVRREEIDVVLTSSPPTSVHLVGAAVKRMTGIHWVADLRDPVVTEPHRQAGGGVRAHERVSEQVARLVARQADAIVCATEAVAGEAQALQPRGRVETASNGSDFDGLADLLWSLE